MNAFKGTPGPWALQMAEDCPGRQLDEMVKWVVTANSHDLWVSMGPTWDAEYDAEALANAHLIAAAPEFLAFAERVSRLNPNAGEIGAGMLAQLVDEAQRIVAKATGDRP